MTTYSLDSLTTHKPEELIKEFRKKVALQTKRWDELCLEAFVIQYKFNQVYRVYVDSLGVSPSEVRSVQTIPFLPIEFFKTQDVRTGDWETEKTFKSSGTTFTRRSEHDIDDVGFYLRHAVQLFTDQYGDLSEMTIIALLPSYQQQGDSSLIAMVDELIELTNSEYSGYYLTRPDEIQEAVNKSNLAGRHSILIGVSFALLDLAEMGGLSLSNSTIIETGGMKGRREELIRIELHERLGSAFDRGEIHSEYGMTELMSQAYSDGMGIFKENNWLKCLIRDINDPLTYIEGGKTGGINIIDLANIHSCCFIETKDLGIKRANERIEILGRFDNSDIRGCNLLL